MNKRIDPELRENLALFPKLNLDNITETRKALAELNGAVSIPIDESVSVYDQMVPGPDNNPALRVQIYEPKEKTESIPGFLWIHGGGYVLGSPDSDDLLCQRYDLKANCVVVSVDYRLAPEHPYPAPLEDCYAALQ